MVEGFHKDAAKARRISAGVAFDTNKRKNPVLDFEIVRYEEPVGVADYGLERVKLVRLAARKKP